MSVKRNVTVPVGKRVVRCPDSELIGPVIANVACYTSSSTVCRIAVIVAPKRSPLEPTSSSFDHIASTRPAITTDLRGIRDPG